MSITIPVVSASGAKSTVTLPDPTVGTRLFNGDYSTGDFSQWPNLQSKGYNSSGSKFAPTYAASIVKDPIKGMAARWELRPGDFPPNMGPNERTQVAAGTASGGIEGQIRWYSFSVKFDSSFPQAKHGDWEVTNGWHPDSSTGSGPFQWAVDWQDGMWSLVVQRQSAPAVYLGTFPIFHTPMNVGKWIDVKMQVLFSPSDTVGWIRLWINGTRQKFLDGSDTYFVRTLVPGTTTVYYKEGLYRSPVSTTDILYSAGFRAATDESAL